ncbi:MAG TPA: MFS transporter [Candidatus Polarisedimenticolaceae bacterium]|nr:MFS transporter [Candidatus Polarisedimenticolaceae bacterium]
MPRSRNVAVLAGSIFGLSMAEELWQQFLPKYIAALGAGGRTIGAFASVRDLLDGLYQYPGGWLADRFGRKRALMLMTAIAMLGYVVYAVAGTGPAVIAGLFLVMAWKSGAFPTTFAVVGDALPKERRSVAFAVQSVLVRVPRVIGAPIGGALIVALGVVAGVRAALLASITIAALVLLAQQIGFADAEATTAADRSSARVVWQRMAPSLKRLLAADALVRIGEGIAASFIVLYVTGPLGRSAAAFGVLYAIQQSVAIVMYLPMGRLADLTGRRPLVAATFVAFAAFPVAVRFAHGWPALVAAFVVGGLKEMGEPARKAMIVDLSDPAHRARSVGVYYTIRNLLVVPAGAFGGWLYTREPGLPLMVAGAVGAIGVIVYLATTRRAEVKSPRS